MYRAFSYNGKRQMSRQIIEGVLERFGPMFCHSNIINYGNLHNIDFIRTKTLCQGGVILALYKTMSKVRNLISLLRFISYLYHIIQKPQCI